MTAARVAAAVGAIALFAGAASAAGYGVLLWVAVPSSDSATSSLVLVGVVLVAVGAVLALVGALLVRFAFGLRRADRTSQVG
jgi:hypothetical protein